MLVKNEMAKIPILLLCSISSHNEAQFLDYHKCKPNLFEQQQTWFPHAKN